LRARVPIKPLSEIAGSGDQFTNDYVIYRRRADRVVNIFPLRQTKVGGISPRFITTRLHQNDNVR